MPSATREQEPWRDEWPETVSDPLDEDIALQKKIEQSEFWRLFKRAIEELRELTFQTSPSTTEMLQRREGALGQLTYLLHHTPVLVVMQQRKEQEHG